MTEEMSLPFSEPTTSRDAAIKMGKRPTKVHEDRRAILWHLHKHGPSHDLEMQESIPMNQNTQRPRRGELVKAGRVVAVGRRDGRTVWGLSE